MSYKRVKLNNPLMGTETSSPIRMGYIDKLLAVKLNNPLTGPVLISKTHISTKI